MRFKILPRNLAATSASHRTCGGRRGVQGSAAFRLAGAGNR